MNAYSMTTGTQIKSSEPAIQGTPELAVIVPTFNERDNIEPLIARLSDALHGCRWEVVFVDDDSPDGTGDQIARFSRKDFRIRHIRRVGRRGLAGSCIEGMLSTSAPYIAVMDGDLQHDESIIPSMLEKLQQPSVDLVIGSRDQSYEKSPLSKPRRWVSWIGNRIAAAALGIEVRDPMSGFFMVKRDLVHRYARCLSSEGFKILLDILICARGQIQLVELDYLFRSRNRGTSKLDSKVALDFVALLLGKMSNGLLGPRFVLFCFVGVSGIPIHMAVLLSVMKSNYATFIVAQSLATACATAWNFTLNNFLTYRDRRRRGVAFVSGLFLFEIACGMGAISNIGVAYVLYGADQRWWLAGLSGALIGAVWNFVVSSRLIWRA